MKVIAQTIAADVVAERNWVAIYSDLFKARLTLLVLLTTLVGFYLGSHGPVDYRLMFNTILGAALLVSGAAALNQLLEREHDARMRRTQTRPLPAGRLQPRTVFALGWGMSLLGVVYMTLAVNWFASGVGTCSLLLYLFVYTPLKRISWINTLIGAIPGGLPPLIGWTAARGDISAEGLLLVAIQGFWQIPHFLAIAWLYRDEYAKAGFKMLPIVDTNGKRTTRQAVLSTVLLVSASLLPLAYGMSGVAYTSVALVLGIGFLVLAIRFAMLLNESRARQLFYASLAY